LSFVIGKKIALISDKAQTTRNKTQGVLSVNDAQMIFIDTPGIHKPKHKLGDFMVKVAQESIKDVDATLFMINANEGYGRGDEFIIEKLQGTRSPVILVINKIDTIHPDELFNLITKYKDLYIVCSKGKTKATYRAENVLEFRRYFIPEFEAGTKTNIYFAHGCATDCSALLVFDKDTTAQYSDYLEVVKYNVPLEWTEWNMKCWGTRPTSSSSATRLRAPSAGPRN